MKHTVVVGLTHNTSSAVQSHARYSDRAMGWRARFCGIGGAATLYALIFGIALFSWRVVHPASTPSTPLVVNLLPLAAPPELVQQVPEGQQQDEQDKKQPLEQQAVLPPVLLSHASPVVTQNETAQEQVETTEQVSRTTAPKSLPAPPNANVSSDTEYTWEALLLAHLERFRRYPSAAKLRREQGVAYVKFRMSRSGQIVSASIGRSSGSRILDQAAIETIRRAQPLPAIPEDRPSELDLSVPVSFFVSQRR